MNIQLGKFIEPLSFRLYNSAGSEVMKGMINKREQSIDLSKNKKGIYLLELKSKSEKSTTKIILQ